MIHVWTEQETLVDFIREADGDFCFVAEDKTVTTPWRRAALVTVAPDSKGDERRVLDLVTIWEAQPK